MAIADPRSKISFALEAAEPSLPDVVNAGLLLGCGSAFVDTPRTYGSGAAVRSVFAETPLTVAAEAHFACDTNRRPILVCGMDVATDGVLHLDTTAVVGGGTATPDGTVKPLGDWRAVRIEVIVGFTAGQAGGMIDFSIDDDVRNVRKSVGIATSIGDDALGIKINLSGDFDAGSVITGWTDPPMWDTTALANAKTAILNSSHKFTAIHIAEPIDPAQHWAALIALLNDLESGIPNRPAFLIVSTRRQYHNATFAGAITVADTSPPTITRLEETFGSITSDPGSFPVQLADGDTYIGSVDEGGSVTLTIAADPASLTFTGGSYAAGAGGDSATFDVVIMNVHVSFFLDLSAVGNTQADYHAALETVPGLFITDDATDIVATTEQAGSAAAATITAIGGAAAAKLGIVGSAPISFAGAGGNVPNVDNVSAAEFVAFTVADGGIAGSTFTANGNGSVTWTTDTAGDTPNGVQWTGSGGLSKIDGFDTAEHNGGSGPGGSFIDDGYKPNMRITLTDSASNDGTYVKIASLTATVLTLTDNVSLTAEVATPDVTIVGSETLEDYGINTAEEWNSYRDYRVCWTNASIRALRADGFAPDQMVGPFLWDRVISTGIQIEPAQHSTANGGGPVAKALAGRLTQANILVLPDAAVTSQMVDPPSRSTALERAGNGTGPYFTQARTSDETSEADRLIHTRILQVAKYALIEVASGLQFSGYDPDPTNPNKLSAGSMADIEEKFRAALRSTVGPALSNRDKEDPEGSLVEILDSDLSTGILQVRCFFRSLFFARGFAFTLAVKAPGQ